MKKQTTVLKSLFVGSGVLMSVVSLIAPVMAQTVSPTLTLQPTVTKKPNETAKQKCDRIKLIVEEKKAALKGKVEELPTQFSGLITVYENNIAKLKAEGVDTSKLEASLVKLKALLEQRRNLRTTLATAALDKVSDIQCGKVKKEDLKTVFETKRAEFNASKTAFDAEIKAVLKELQSAGAAVRAVRNERPTPSKKAEGTKTPVATRAPEVTKKNEVKPTPTEKVKASPTVKVTVKVTPTSVRATDISLNN